MSFFRFSYILVAFFTCQIVLLTRKGCCIAFPSLFPCVIQQPSKECFFRFFHLPFIFLLPFLLLLFICIKANLQNNKKFRAVFFFFLVLSSSKVAANSQCRLFPISNVILKAERQTKYDVTLILSASKFSIDWSATYVFICSAEVCMSAKWLSCLLNTSYLQVITSLTPSPIYCDTSGRTKWCKPV